MESEQLKGPGDKGGVCKSQVSIYVIRTNITSSLYIDQEAKEEPSPDTPPVPTDSLNILRHHRICESNYECLSLSLEKKNLQ